MSMLSIDFGGTRFNYRVAGVLLRGNRILLHKEEKDLYWYLPGGRCELMEASAETLVREFREEANATIEVQRLLWVIENFYNAHGETFHELGLYHLVTSNDIDMREEFTGVEANGNILYFRWFDIDALDSVRVLPLCLREAVKNIDNGITHYVNREI